MGPLHVLIADDHPLFRKGMRALLTTAPDFTVVGEATTGRGVTGIAIAAPALTTTAASVAAVTIIVIWFISLPGNTADDCGEWSHLADSLPFEGFNDCEGTNVMLPDEKRVNSIRGITSRSTRRIVDQAASAKLNAV